ncbi:MAG: DUF4197 domain-containing protein [Alphaproteobacteria bacterium]
MVDMTRRIVLTGALTVAALPALAQGNLLQQGKGLLDSISKGGGGSSGGSALSQVKVGKGLKEALQVGSENVVGQLGATNGFFTDEIVKILLPDWLETVRSTLSRVGQSDMLDDLTLRMNRGAEQATAQVKPLFWDSIEAMTLQDVMDIYNGPDDAATQYFRRTMNDPLHTKMKPIVDTSLSDVGAIQSYESTVSQYKSIPFVPDVKGDIVEHVLDKAFDGIFHYIGVEEAAIRNNASARVTPLLQEVFG